MKPVVDHDLCIGCALCAEICPQVFELRDDDLAYIIDEEGCSVHGCCEEAAEQCPVEAITLESD